MFLPTGPSHPKSSHSPRFWFRPYGQVLELRPLAESPGAASGAYLVKLSSVEEATAALAALHGKPVMKGSPLVVRYWHG